MILIITITLGVLLTACLLRLIFLKSELRQLNLRLGKIINTDTNALLKVKSLDKDIAVFAETINATLERNRRDYFEKVCTEADLKRAITNISHDLRTPLTSALGYIQMLKSARGDEETRNQYLEIIQERLETLTMLLNGLFEFACVIEGDSILNLQKVNAYNAVCEVLSASYTELEDKGFKVDVDIPDRPVMYICDASTFGRILQNLIENAYVHGREYLGVRFEGDAMEITNKVDRPCEIDTARLFERFYTLDASRSNKRTGLGLAIVKELVQQMDGTISARIEGNMLVIQVTFPQYYIGTNRR
jgi:signal transduction histidine kinase